MRVSDIGTDCPERLWSLHPESSSKLSMALGNLIYVCSAVELEVG